MLGGASRGPQPRFHTRLRRSAPALSPGADRLGLPPAASRPGPETFTQRHLPHGERGASAQLSLTFTSLVWKVRPSEKAPRAPGPAAALKFPALCGARAPYRPRAPPRSPRARTLAAASHGARSRRSSARATRAGSPHARGPLTCSGASGVLRRRSPGPATPCLAAPGPAERALRGAQDAQDSHAALCCCPSCTAAASDPGASYARAADVRRVPRAPRRL